MKRLYLLRHAKASRGKAGHEDIDRPLTERGRHDSTCMGRFLREEVYLPDLVLCSPSVRTRETLHLVMLELGAAPGVLHLHELYLAKDTQIVAMVRESSNAAGSLMVVGHNPGMEECARKLCAVPADRKLRKQYDCMTDKFPTAALAVIDFNLASWTEVTGGAGELELFIRPRDLRGGDD